MPIGVPRIIYCWGEELPAQWTDIYNFIFRRRMVFLMQYLDDELCNQICGLLINIHMEDRSKELEKKEIERSGLFKTASKAQKAKNGLGNEVSHDVPQGQIGGTSNLQNKKIAGPSFEDLLAADEDLGIDENNTLEQYTLQKITMEWLNWNAQFFDYSDEPYLFYLAEMLSKDFNKGDARMLYSPYKNQSENSGRMLENSNQNLEDVSKASFSRVFPPFGGKEQDSVSKEEKKKDQTSFSQEGKGTASFMQFFEHFSSNSQTKFKNDLIPSLEGNGVFIPFRVKGNSQKVGKLGHLDIYSPFRLLANFAAQDYNFKEINSLAYSGLNRSVASVTPSFGSPLAKQGGEEEDEGVKQGNQHSLTNKFDKNEEFSKRELFKLFNSTVKKKGFAILPKSGKGISQVQGNQQSNNMSKLFTELGQKNFSQKINSQTNLFKTAEKALSQRSLRKEYVQDKTLNSYHTSKLKSGAQNKSSSFSHPSIYPLKGEEKAISQLTQKTDSLNYLDFYSYNDSYTEFRNTQRGKQTERTLQEEEAKKVFVIINSFGGSVGNGITVHDALQFIKAGSLTLALGVAASAASLALAGGTIGERYVTEGCHVMIHQPESSIQGQASDIWIDSQEIMKIRLDVAEIYSLATYRPRHKILRDLDRDFYLTATETIHYGLADEIATNEVMHEIIEMTSKVWDYHDTKQQRLLESRDTSNSGLDTQSQN